SALIKMILGFACMDRRSPPKRSLLDITQFPQPLGNQGFIFRPDHGRGVLRRRGSWWLGDNHIPRGFFAGFLLHMLLTALVTIPYATGRNQAARAVWRFGRFSLAEG